MILLERYLQNDTVNVYNELYALGEDALKPGNAEQVHLIMQETFRRVKFNLDVIYAELKKINYRFDPAIEYNWQQPVSPPEQDIETLLQSARLKLKNAGHLPLSLEYFYRAVGSVNFCWDWKAYPDIPWEGADPIDIPPFSMLLNELVYDDYDREDIILAGDYLHKDNISGSCYNIQLTPVPLIDSLLLHDDWDIPFIEYLRITFDNCGFSMADECEYDDLDLFCERVRPLLQPI